MAAKKKPQLPKDPEAIRKLILEDPNTAQIAEKIGVPLEDYVAQVVKFVMNPSEEPSLYVAEDDDLRAIGWEPPDPDAMGQYLLEGVSVAKAAEGTEFTDPKKRLVAMPDAPDAPATGKANPKLKAEVEKQLKSGRNRRG